MTEDEMVGWHHRLNEHEFERTPGHSEGQIGRASCRERVETVSDFIFWGSKITTDGDCSHEIKRRLLLGRKVMT